MRHNIIPFRRADVAPGCTGPCDHGDRKCPTPDACRQPDEPPRAAMTELDRWLLFVLAVISICVVASLSIVVGKRTLTLIDKPAPASAPATTLNGLT